MKSLAKRARCLAEELQKWHLDGLRVAAGRGQRCSGLSTLGTNVCFWAGRLPGAVQDVLALAPEDRRLVVLAPQASGRLSVSYI